MAIHTLRYILDDEGIEIMAGCAAQRIIEEQEGAIREAFSDISLTIEIDDDWGVCKILAVNGLDVEDTYGVR